MRKLTTGVVDVARVPTAVIVNTFVPTTDTFAVNSEAEVSANKFTEAAATVDVAATFSE